MTLRRPLLDLAGIGIGPFNLSLAALADGVADLDCAFFERKPRFSWHPGLAFPDSVLQTSFLKDLVTPVRPTSPWSFVNFLVAHGRFFDFLSGRFAAVSRREFTQYMAWVAGGLEGCRFGAGIAEIDHDGGRFVLRGQDGQVTHSRAIAVGTGLTPRLPEGAPLGPDCLHVESFLTRPPRIEGRRVVVIGGGQSGAEVMLDLLGRAGRPASITWISRRDGFWSLQEGGLVDQFFTPGYLGAYRSWGPEGQAASRASLKYASDGLTPATCDALYAALYRRRHVEGAGDVTLRPGRHVARIDRGARGGFAVETRDPEGGRARVGADVVLLATGFETRLPACLGPLAGRLGRGPGGGLRLDDGYRAAWDGPAEAAIYGLNQGRDSHGLIDPQLSMAAWRSAAILNDLTGREEFDLARRDPGLVDWPRGAAPAVARTVAAVS